MIRRYGEAVRPGQRYVARPGAYALIFHPVTGAMLLTHQAEPYHEYQLPGGGIDPGESPLPALYREVMEETGYRIAAPRRIGAFRRFAYMPEYRIWAEKVCTLYVAVAGPRHGPPTEAGHTAHWVAPRAVPDMLANPGDRAFVSDYLARASRPS